MCTQNQQVFQHCVALAKELEASGRAAEGVSVLRSLAVYLDSLPAFPDKSCKKMAESLLDLMAARVREKDRSSRNLMGSR